MATPSLTRSIGTAERAMRALLERELARERLSFAQWAALVFSDATPVSAQQIVQRLLTGHVVANESQAQEAITNLVSLGVLTNNADETLQHSRKGRDLFAALSKSIEQITSALYGDLPEPELEATHRTLLEIAARANRLLAAK